MAKFYESQEEKYKLEAEMKQTKTHTKVEIDREPELLTTLLNHYGISEGRRFDGFKVETVLS